MNDTDRLRDLLEQAAPAHPDLDPTTRAAAVARRGRTVRRRELALVAAVAVAVVALPIAIPLAVGRGDRPSEPVPAPAILVTEPCPDSPMDVQDLDVVPFPLGHVDAVRSCPVNGPAVDPLPTEPLGGAAAQAFADDVAALPDYRLPPICALVSVAMDPWALQVQKADGELVTIGSTVRICDAVRIDGVDRGVEQVLAAFEGNLARQQSGVPQLACPTGKQLADGAATWNASFDPATATAGVVCYRADPMGGPEYAGTEGELSADQLAEVRDDLVSNLGTSAGDGTCFDTAPQRLIVLADGDGDQTALLDQGCLGEFAAARGFWTPSPAAEDAIAAALGGRVTG